MAESVIPSYKWDSGYRANSTGRCAVWFWGTEKNDLRPKFGALLR